MTRVHYKVITLCLLVGVFSIPSKAQYSFYNKPQIEKWVYAGGAHFFGDLGGAQVNGLTIAGSEDLDFTNFKPAVGAGIRVNLKRWFALRGGIGYAFLKQSDANSVNASQNRRNLSFQTHTWEFTALTELRVVSFQIKTQKRKSYWEYYVFGGAGGVYYNPKAMYNEKLVALRPLTTEGQGLKPGTKKYSAVAGCFPIGGGLRLGTKQQSSFFIEMGYRITTSDYIDDVSDKYYKHEELLLKRGKTSAEMSYRGESSEYPTGRTRGNPFNKDSFLIINIGFSTSLNSGKTIRFHGR